MADVEIEKKFPNISGEGYVETSLPDLKYNCIAWAANDNKRFWWPDWQHVGFWPISLRAVRLDNFIAAFATLGYERCDSGELEDDFEKVVIYLNSTGAPTHMARQLKDGKWTSKLGPYKDISHTLNGVEGSEYGYVGTFLRRKV
jgi:hypothetical protein